MKISREETKDLSNNAKILYMEFVAIHPDMNPTDELMRKRCNMGLGTYKKAKVELRQKGILYVRPLGGKGNNTIYYFGKEAVSNIKKELNK